jgi:hypothetical protein
MRILITLLCCLPLVGQTTFTTIANGGTRDVTDATAWIGGIAPPVGCPVAPGFVVAIDNGTLLNIPNGVTWCPGASDSVVTTTAVVCTNNTISGTGGLNVASGGVLQARGRLAMCNGAWHVAAGGAILFDSSLATGTPIYSIGTTFADATNAKLYLDGVSFTDCTPGVSTTTCSYIGIIPGSGNYTIEAQISTGNRDGGQVIGQYVVLDHCGSSTLYCLAVDLHASTAVFDLHNVLFTNSAGVAFTEVCGACILRFHHYSMPSYTGNGTALTFGVGGTTYATKTTGIREVHHGYMTGGTVAFTFGGSGSDLGLNFYENVWRTVEPTLVLTDNQTAMPACTSGAPNWNCVGHFSGTEWRNNVFWQRVTDGAAPIPSAIVGLTTRTIDLFDWVTETCPSWGVSTNNIAHTLNSPRFIHQIDQWIFQTRCGGEQNKGLNWSNGGSAISDYPVVITNSLYLSGDNGLGWVLPLLGVSSNTCNGTTSFCGRVSFTNNTVAQVGFSSISSLDPCGISTESTNVTTGIFVNVSGNLEWSPAPYNGCVEGLMQSSTYGGFINMMTGIHDYNWDYRLTGTFGPTDPAFYRFGSQAYYSTVPGVHDGSGDPKFLQFDPNAVAPSYRDWGSFCKYVDATNTDWNTCIGRWSDIYKDTWNDSIYSVSRAIDWIRTGYIMFNRATWTAGPTGAYVGGVRPLGLMPGVPR